MLRVSEYTFLLRERDLLQAKRGYTTGGLLLRSTYHCKRQRCGQTGKFTIRFFQLALLMYLSNILLLRIKNFLNFKYLESA